MTRDSRVFRSALHHWNCLRLLRQSGLLFECLYLVHSKHHTRPSPARAHQDNVVRVRVCIANSSNFAFPLLVNHPLLVPYHLGSARRFLLLVIHKLDVVLGYLLVPLVQEVLDLVAHVALYHDLLASRRGLGDAGTGGELLAELLGDLLEVEVEGLEPRDGRDVLALVALDSLDGDDAGGALVGLLLLSGLGLGRLLQGVLLGALLGLDREVGCGGC